LRNLRWFEEVPTQGQVDSGKVHHYQVVIRADSTLEGEFP